MKLSGYLAVISALLWLPPLWSQKSIVSEDSLVTKIEKVELFRGNCEAPGSGCINISLSFPVAVDGNPTTRKQINQSIYTELIRLFRLNLEPLAPDKPGLELAMNEFSEEWESACADRKDPENWIVLAEGQVAYHSNRVLVVSLNSRVVTDEYVPEDRITALNFDLKTGEKILLPSIVSDSLAFISLVMDKLQSSYPKLHQLYDLNDPTAFPLPENFEFRSTGIFLWFNEMDAPLLPGGPVSIFLTYDELDGIVRREKYF